MKLRAFVAFASGVVIASSLGVGDMASLNVAAKELTPYRTCVVTGTPAGTSAVIDSSVRQASPTSNFGTAATDLVASAGTANRRLYINFNLSGCSPTIPSTAIVKRATMRLYVSALPAVCRTLDIFRVTATWTELGITWNNQPFGTAINNPASGSRTDSFDVGTPVGCENRVVGYTTGADVTTDVEAFVTSGVANYGWMVRDDVEGSATARTTTFSSKNRSIATQAPQLLVTWTP